MNLHKSDVDVFSQSSVQMSSCIETERDSDLELWTLHSNETATLLAMEPERVRPLIFFTQPIIVYWCAVTRRQELGVHCTTDNSALQDSSTPEYGLSPETEESDDSA
jgi:hypothetical protein